MFATSANAPTAALAAAARGVTLRRLGALASSASMILMLAGPANAQAAGGAADGGFLASPLGSLLLFVPMILLFWLLIIRPQSKRAKEHQAMVSAVKRGDEVVMSNGMMGKVTRVENEVAMVEIATGVNVRVVKSMIAEVKAKGQPAIANDAKS